MLIAGFFLCAGLTVARIRTIKPDFFTSEDIVSLSPLARLLYVALWCEADREGRMRWRPGTFEMRYFPKDGADMAAVCAELTSRRLVVLYGDGLAYIPTFREHQHVNPREAASTLPSPPVDKSRVSDASHLELLAQVGREGKEGKGKEHASARVDCAEKDQTPKALQSPTWWKTHAGIDEMGRQLGIAARRGEDYAEYKSRLFDALNSKKAAVA